MGVVAQLAPLRADAYRNLMKVVWVLAASASADGGVVAWPGWDYLAERTGLSRRTVARCLERLRGYGLLGVASPGMTPLQRSGVLDDGIGDQRAEYLLCVPALPGADRDIHDTDETETTSSQVNEAGEESGTPTVVSVGNNGEGSAPDARAWAHPPSKPRHSASTPPGRGETGDQHITWTHGLTGVRPWVGDGGAGRPWRMTATPRTKAEMLAAAQRLRAEAVTLRPLTARHLRALLRPAFRAGATPRDVLHALDHQPDGRTWRHTHAVRHLPGWIRYRLAAWHTDDGGFHPWPSQRAAQARQDLRETRRQERGSAAATRGAAADPEHVRTLAAARRARLLEERGRRRHVDVAEEPAASDGKLSTDSHGSEVVDFEAHRQAQITALQAWTQQAGSG